MTTSAHRAALKLTTDLLLGAPPSSKPKVPAPGAANSAGPVVEPAIGNAAASSYTADLSPRMADEGAVGEAVGSDITPSAIPPTADPNYIENAVKRVAVFGWGGPFQLSRTQTGLTSDDPVVPRTAFSLDNDPLAAAHFELQRVYKTRTAADEAIARIPAKFTGRYAYYVGPGRLIFPTVVSDTTAPALCAALRRAWAEHQANARVAANTSEDLLWWYVGARLLIRAKTGADTGKAAVKDASKTASAGAVMSKVEQALHTIVNGTQATAIPGKRMIEAAKLLARMKDLNAAEKVRVMLKFLDHIRFAISKAGVVEKADHFVMYAENELSAFKFMKETGEILYGKFARGTVGYGDYVWSVLK